MTTEISDFPSITFPATFEGTAAIGADFSATLKLKTSDGPAVLRDLNGLPRGTYDVTIVSRQSALDGDSAGREWANQQLDVTANGDGELEYEEHCIGSRCPVFLCHSSGEFEGKYVCEHHAESEAYIEVVYGETVCPRYGAGETEEAEAATDEAVGETDADDSGTIPGEPETDKAARGGAVVIALYPGDDEPHVTQVGDTTRYGELVFDFFAEQQIEADDPSDFKVTGEDDGNERELEAVIDPADYGKRLIVEPVA